MASRMKMCCCQPQECRRGPGPGRASSWPWRRRQHVHRPPLNQYSGSPSREKKEDNKWSIKRRPRRASAHEDDMRWVVRPGAAGGKVAMKADARLSTSFIPFPRPSLTRTWGERGRPCCRSPRPPPHSRVDPWVMVTWGGSTPWPLHYERGTSTSTPRSMSSSSSSSDWRRRGRLQGGSRALPGLVALGRQTALRVITVMSGCIPCTPWFRRTAF